MSSLLLFILDKLPFLFDRRAYPAGFTPLPNDIWLVSSGACLSNESGENVCSWGSLFCDDNLIEFYGMLPRLLSSMLPALALDPSVSSEFFL